jgi:hypothetical protein
MLISLLFELSLRNTPPSCHSLFLGKSAVLQVTLKLRGRALWGTHGTVGRKMFGTHRTASLKLKRGTRLTKLKVLVTHENKGKSAWRNSGSMGKSAVRISGLWGRVHCK